MIIKPNTRLGTNINTQFKVEIIRYNTEQYQLCYRLLHTMQEEPYLIGAVAPSGPSSSDAGTRSHLKCRPQLNPPRTTGEEL